MAGYVRALPGRVARRSVGGGTAYQPSRGSRPLLGARLVVQRLRASPDTARHELRKEAVRDYGAVGSADRLLLEREATQRLKNNSPFVCCEPHAHPRRCWGHGASRLRCGDLPSEQAAFRSAANLLRTWYASSTRSFATAGAADGAPSARAPVDSVEESRLAAGRDPLLSAGRQP